jgi:hypothetical protein
VPSSGGYDTYDKGMPVGGDRNSGNFYTHDKDRFERNEARFAKMKSSHTNDGSDEVEP